MQKCKFKNTQLTTKNETFSTSCDDDPVCNITHDPVEQKKHYFNYQLMN